MTPNYSYPTQYDYIYPPDMLPQPIWMPQRDGHVPHDAVLCGQDSESTYYVARTVHAGRNIPGNVY